MAYMQNERSCTTMYCKHKHCCLYKSRFNGIQYAIDASIWSKQLVSIVSLLEPLVLQSNCSYTNQLGCVTRASDANWTQYHSFETLNMIQQIQTPLQRTYLLAPHKENADSSGARLLRHYPAYTKCTIPCRNDDLSFGCFLSAPSLEQIGGSIHGLKRKSRF